MDFTSGEKMETLFSVHIEAYGFHKHKLTHRLLMDVKSTVARY